MLKPHRIAGVLVLAAALWAGAAWNTRGTPIGGLDHQPVTLIGAPAVANPFPFAVPQHPYLGLENWSNIHGGATASGVQPVTGPLGRRPMIHSRHGSTSPGGECATAVLTRGGHLVVSCGSLAGFELNLLEPRTLRLLAVFEIPQRPSTFAAVATLDPDKAFSDTTGGAYFYLDHHERAVFADPQQRIWRIAHRQLDDGQWEFYVDSQFDLRHLVPHDCLAINNWFPQGECDPITSVGPDYDGRIWWATRQGRIGTVDPETGSIRAIHFAGEGVQNSFPMDATAVYIVTDHRLYALSATRDGTPEVLWSIDYERSDKRKLGQFDTGSGTTPSLLGSRYITITDNASDQSHLLVFRRRHQVEGDRLVCRLPLFEPGASAVEISVLAWDRTIIVKNEFGYTNFLNRGWADDFAGGAVRIDVRPDESGCDLIWHSEEPMPSITPRVSSETGLLYTYTFEQEPGGEIVWAVTAIDVRTGQTRFRIPTGSGTQFDASWAPITLGLDGTLYVGTSVGLLAIWDRG